MNSVVNERPLLLVTSFGGFSIAVHTSAKAECDAPVITDSMGHSKKLWTFMEYLLFSGKEKVSAEELIELLWPEEGCADPLNSLRLLVHRARLELNCLGCYKGSELILGGNGTYGWNRGVPLTVDTENFEILCHASLKGSPSERLDTKMSAIALYKGRFLPKTSYQQWAMTLNTYYQSKYTALCLEAIDLLRSLGRFRDIIGVCTKAITMDPYNEPFHIALIEALTAVGDYKEALDHYRRITDILLKELGIKPSEKLTAVYQVLSRKIHALESDIGAIHNSLVEDNSGGAFYCEYEIFKQIYNLKLRECRRNGEMAQLALITVSPAGGRNPGARSRRTVMDRLGSIIRDSLRQGDVYTRFSAMQYLLFLPSASCENGKLVLERIQCNYKLSVSKSDYLFQFSLLSILPKDPLGDYMI